MFHVKQSALTELHPENIQPAAKCNQRLLASLARDSKKWPVPPPTLSSAGVEWRGYFLAECALEFPSLRKKSQPQQPHGYLLHSGKRSR